MIAKNFGLSAAALSAFAVRVLAQDTVVLNIYNGSVSADWQDWSWGLVSSDPAYSGYPTAPSGHAAYQADVPQWSAISFYSPTGFPGAKTLSFRFAGNDVPTFDVVLSDGSTESRRLSTQAYCDSQTSGVYATCTFDLAPLGDNNWNRFYIQNTGAENIVYLTDAYLTSAPQPPYVVPDQYPTYPANEQWCSDVAPSSDYTCAQQASWGKCDLSANPWMAGFCMQTCGACPKYASRSQPWNFAKLIDQKATSETKLLYEFLKTINGKNVLTGQAETADTSQDREAEFSHLKNVTGSTPAVRLMDLIFYVGDPAFEDGSIDRAINWWRNKYGIVQYQWHWRAPMNGSDFYASKTSFDIRRAVTPGTQEYKLAIRDIGIVISKMRLLQNARVPVIFRPLHEPNGGWFWWGTKGPAPYVAMWNLIQSEFKKANIHNVIWLHNFAGAPQPDWFPGADKVDIVSVDRYSNPGVYDAYPSDFYQLKYLTNATKLQTMAENGPIPDIGLMQQTGALWSYFATWNSDYVMSQKYNSNKHIAEVFQSNVTLKLEDLQLIAKKKGGYRLDDD